MQEDLITCDSDDMEHVPSMTSVRKFLQFLFDLRWLKNNINCLFIYQCQEHNNNIINTCIYATYKQALPCLSHYSLWKCYFLFTSNFSQTQLSIKEGLPVITLHYA